MAQGIADAVNRAGETVTTGDVDTGRVHERQRECSPAWNSSTMCLSVLHRAMTAQGWQTGQLDISVSDGDGGPLPRRPLDLGVGWWR